MAAEERCICGDKECFGMVVPVFGAVRHQTEAQSKKISTVLRAGFLTDTFA